jgi:uncharacterized membrane protein
MSDNAPSTSVAKADDNVIAALATIPIVGLIIWFAMKDASSLVKFYAKQGTGLTIVFFILVFGGIFAPLFAGLIWNLFATLVGCFVFLLSLAVVVLWIIVFIKALQGEIYRVPFLSDTMDKILK